MKLYNGKAIKIGLAIFLVLALLPVWYNLNNLVRAGSTFPPELELPENADACVAPAAYMRSSHMTLLNEWRDSVVREGKRTYTADDGTEYNMSLTKTCLDCHSSKADFCDRCHNYMAVDPYCWDCHNAPGGE